MTTTDIADELIAEYALSGTYSQASVAYWLANHIGDLNNLIGTSFTIGIDTITIGPNMDLEEKAILKILFLIYYSDSRVREFLGAASQDITLEVSSDGATVRTVNKNELSKSFLILSKGLRDDLAALLRGYSGRLVSPLHVAGDDTIDGGYFPYQFRRREP